MGAFTRKAKTFLLSGKDYDNGLTKSDILAINRDLEHIFLNFQTLDNVSTTPFLQIDQSTPQTISGGPLILSQIATPPAPPTGTVAIYCKADGKLYRRPAGGSETLIG